MSVYLDPEFQWKDGKFYSHMTADTEAEMHDFAKSIGLQRSWLHTSSSGIRHYDLSRSKRQTAVKRGAIEVPAKDWLAIAKRNQGQGS